MSRGAHEQGLGGFEAPTWFAVFLPRGASEPIIRKLEVIPSLLTDKRRAALYSVTSSARRRIA
jgi:tripartite-type tricarboxylate transporter receptor subunit TctC